MQIQILFRVLANLDSWDQHHYHFMAAMEKSIKVMGWKQRQKKQEVSSAKKVQMLVDMHEL